MKNVGVFAVFSTCADFRISVVVVEMQARLLCESVAWESSLVPF